MSSAISLSLSRKISLLIILIAGCGESHFLAESKASPSQSIYKQELKQRDALRGVVSQEAQLSLACSSMTPPRLAVTKDSHLQLTITGEVCMSEVSSAPVHVIYVVDASGSMLQADPKEQGSCGRLKAIAALTAKMKNLAVTGKISIVTFGDRAQVITAHQDIAAFQAEPWAQTICDYREGGTNYTAALNMVDQKLLEDEGEESSPSQKPLLFFLTDGLPDHFSVGNAGQRALQASISLRERIPRLAINAVFLSPNRRKHQEAAEYLVQFTGSAENVRTVSTVEELAQSLENWDLSQTLDISSLRGEVREGELSVTVKLAKLLPPVISGGFWSFVTHKMVLPPPTQDEQVITFTLLRGDEVHNPLMAQNFILDPR